MKTAQVSFFSFWKKNTKRTASILLHGFYHVTYHILHDTVGSASNS